MTTFTAAKAELLHSVTKDGNLFEVYKGQDDEVGYGYVGYCNGERSVVATSVDVALRSLDAKHCLGLPLGRELPTVAEQDNVVDFTARRLAKVQAEIY